MPLSDPECPLSCHCVPRSASECLGVPRIDSWSASRRISQKSPPHLAASRRISSCDAPPRVSSHPQCGVRPWMALTCSRLCGPSRRPSQRSCGALGWIRSVCPKIPRLVFLTSAAGCSRGAWRRHRSRTLRHAARHPARAVATRSAAGECGVAVEEAWEEGGWVPTHACLKVHASRGKCGGWVPMRRGLRRAVAAHERACGGAPPNCDSQPYFSQHSLIFESVPQKSSSSNRNDPLRKHNARSTTRDAATKS